MRVVLILTIAIAYSLPSRSLPADWPMGGRSGDRNPVSPELPVPTDWQLGEMGKNGRNILWSAEVGTSAAGGPIVSGGLVWVGTNNKSLHEENRPDRAVLSCFRESDGKLLYRYLSTRRGNMTTDWPGQSLSGSPLAEGDRLWFITNRREVICFDTTPLRRGIGDPKTMWALDMVETLKVHPQGLMIPWADTLGSPTVYEDFLYISTGNARSHETGHVPAPEAPSLICIHKDNGKVIWKDNSPGKNLLYGVSASPLVIKTPGRVQVIHPQADGWVRSFDALTGKLLWKFDVNYKKAKGDKALYGGDRIGVLSTPVLVDGRVYFGTGTEAEACGSSLGRLFCVDPTKNGDISPELDAGPEFGKPNPNSGVVWEFSHADPGKGDSMHLMLSAVAIHGGLLFAVDCSGVIHCIDVKTGKQLWSHNLKSVVYGSPLVAGGKLYVAAQGGEVWIFDAAATKRVIKKVQGDGTIVPGPVFANGVLYILTEGRLFAIKSE